MHLINGYEIPDDMKTLSEDEFLEGAMICPTFEIDGRSGEDYEPIWECAKFDDTIFEEDGYAIVPLTDFEPYCVVLRHENETVGFYMHGQLWVDDEHRGHSFGAKMVVCASAVIGKAPDVQVVGFSIEGYDAHVKSLEIAREADPSPRI
ncbi:hypothetical protein [Roseibium sp. RKSG952]|uniref:hypothetical protein n=1 Tax=Roseibium sp. RKSG952 TaxID=2529384 RepID=UPI0012BB71FC|nr:hypothetical protein [Roseibium sp. RKSG952]MTH95229.1 hypothetical protein [Roseibium sp. RKSG952]